MQRPNLARKSNIAMRDDSWEEFRKNAEKKRNHQHGLEKIRETYEKVAKAEIGRLDIVLEMSREVRTS